jgi:putative endopeptidase
LNKKIIFAASVAALTLGGQAAAHGDERCLDQACTMLGLAAFASAEQGGGGVAADAKIEAPRLGEWGLDVAGMDRSVRPGENFFDYVSGNWARTTQIPGDRSVYGSFHMLRELSEARVRRLVEAYPVGDPATGGDSAKIASIYGSFMDEAAVEARGAQPLQPYFARIRAAQSHEQMAELMGRGSGGFGRSLFGTSVFDDQRDPDHYALYLFQGGLGLSDRDLYLDERFAAQKARYQQYVAQLLGMAGWSNAEAAAERIVALETRFAEAHWTRAESRDRDKTYNPMTLADLQRDAPGFPWAAWFRAAGIDHAERAVVSQNTAFPKLAQIFAQADLDTLKAWQAFHTADQAAPYLSKAFVDANYDFRLKFLQGQPEQQERWKRGVGLTEAGMGEAIGRDYVQLYFPEESRVKMAELVDNLKVAMHARLENLDWMGPETRAEALAKLSTFNVKIGHPEKWRDYSGLSIVNGDLFGNTERVQQFNWDYSRNRIGKAVDKAEWGMTPQTVNAYYSPVRNEIVFPAAILQPPFFDPKADPAVNYGAIGGVIGHEIIHGFDDQGRKSDGRGVLRDWWTPEDAAKFEVQAARLGAQYESYTFPTLPDMRINARVAMGENIGDLGGLLVAHDAYRVSLGGKPAPVIDGFTGDQRFFMGWGQVWRILWRDDALRQQLVNGPHSPGQIRAFAPLRNIDAWYEAFNVQPSDPLYIPPEERVRIW